MRFLGIDFGWQGKPSGLACLAANDVDLQLVAMERLTSLEDILAWVDEKSAGGPAVVAVDAPTVIRNQTGMRRADRLMHSHFGRYHAGCYPANLGRPYAARTVALGHSLETQGFLHAAEIAARSPGRFQIEVHPHSAIVQLFDLPQIIKYKRGRLADRRLQLSRYRELMLARMPLLLPPLHPPSLPVIPHTGAAMKGIEDQMDAVTCAYVGAHWWHWGAERNLVCGSAEEGYIVVPHRQGFASP
jgi:predicted RNase H-like nuclease